MAEEAAKMGMGPGTVFVVDGPALFGMIHAAAAQAAYADREAGGASVIAYADGVKRWFDANPNWVSEHSLPGDPVASIREVAIPSLKYCEERYGHDNQARVNLESAIGEVGA